MKTKNEDIKREVQASPAPKFTIEKLRENSLKLFGVTQSTFEFISTFFIIFKHPPACTRRR